MKAFPIQNRSSARQGFTIVELVVAFIIIGILATVLVPNVIKRAEQARASVAQQELASLADAQERAAIDMGYFLRPYVLDDVAGGDGNAPDDPSDTIEGVRDNQFSQLYNLPAQIFINLTTQDYATNNASLFQQLIRDETAFNFNGPYINWHRDANDNDWPDDPWGRDYLFFTRAGVLIPPTSGTSSDDESERFQLTYTRGGQTYDATVFDRPTWLSLGPDGAVGDGNQPNTTGFGQGDDIVYKFGSVTYDAEASTVP